MKVLKIVLIVIALLIVVPLLVAAFVKKEYGVEREIVINRPKAEVFNYIKYLKNQDSFSVWSQADPNMKKEYRGTDGTVGFVSAWDSEKKEVGKGEQEIKSIKEGERIDYELRFKVPFEATDYAYMTTEEVSATQTKVKWGFTGKMNYPMNLMLLFMNMEQMLGKDLSRGLGNLKAVLEK
ncbi:MAG TPA: SRPBCC family protein [Cytophagales bacterium]|nr:SRPBCC family protein [Cytophagales bacterium]